MHLPPPPTIIISSLILRKIIKIGATIQMSDFKAKMHPERPAVFKGPTSKGREGKGKRGEEEEQER